jgi:hypothetical protein
MGRLMKSLERRAFFGLVSGRLGKGAEGLETFDLGQSLAGSRYGY